MAMLARKLLESPDISCEICVTGQHAEMLDQVLDLFAIAPTYRFASMSANQSLSDLTCKLLQGLQATIVASCPDLVLVHGDTTTTLAASLSAFYHKVPLGHVEAGLRTGNLSSPWPEEANRLLTARLASLHFAPTEAAARNLSSEGVAESQVFVTGNTVIDSLIWMSDQIDRDVPFLSKIQDRLPFLKSREKKVLVTTHRRENQGEGLKRILSALSELSKQGHIIILPVHPNPNVRGPIIDRLRGQHGVHLIAPLDYRDFVAVMKFCDVVLTDSGGIQEEAPALGKPVLVMRDTTERPEGVAAGTARLIGSDVGQIVSQTNRLLTDEREYQSMSKAVNPYGDGRASQRIIDAILTYQN